MQRPLVIPEEAIPDWIRSANRGVDWGGIIVLGLALLLGSIYWQSGLITLENDSIHTAFRAHDVVTSLREGVLYPRWSPHAIYGLGAPILHFTPPLTAYLTATIKLLFTEHVVTSVTLLMTLALAVGSTATYAFVLQHVGGRAAFVAATTYLLSPAVIWLLPYQFGWLDTFFAASLLPLLAWALDRALRLTSPFDLSLLSLVLAAILLSDPHHYGPIVAIVGIAVCALRPQAARRMWLQLMASFIVGLAMSAVFWLPALLEADATRWQTLPSEKLPSVTFLSLFLPFTPTDPLSGNSLPRYSLGTGLVVLVTGAIVSTVVRRRWQRFEVVTIAAFAGICAAAVWWNQPRWLPTAAWFGSLMGACVVVGISADRVQRQAFIGAIITLAAAFLPVYLSFQRLADDISVDYQAQLQYELRGYGVAGVPMGQPVPSNHLLTALPNQMLVTAYNRAFPDRLSLLVGTPDKVALLRAQSHGSLYTVASASALQASYAVTPFLGWQANFGPIPIPLQANAEMSSYQMTIPPTRGSELHIFFGMTPYRVVGSLLSALGGIAALLLYRSQQRRKDWHASFPPLLSHADLKLLAAAGLTIILAVNVLMSGRFIPPPLPMPGTAFSGSTLLTYVSNSPLQLIGYRVDTPFYDLLSVTLHWRTTRPLSDNLYLTATLVSTAGDTVFDSPVTPLSRMPTSAWRADRYYTTHLALTLPPHVTSGRYTLTLRVFPCVGRGMNCFTGRALSFFDERGASLGMQFTLPRILTRP